MFAILDLLLSQRLMPELEELNTRFFDKLDMVLIDCDERASINHHLKNFDADVQLLV